MAPTISVRRRKHIDLKFPRGPKRVKVGFPAGEASSDIIMRAIWNHYGTAGGASGGGWGGPIPPRPFLLNSVRKNRSKYLTAMRSSAAQIIRGRSSLSEVLTKLGIVGQGDVQQEITDLRTPPNSPVTIRLKGSSNPLIDTGEMRSKVTCKVDHG